MESAEGFADRVDGAAQKAAERAQVAAAQAKVRSEISIPIEMNRLA